MKGEEKAGNKSAKKAGTTFEWTMHMWSLTYESTL
jgi:hypothetical protein